LLRHTEAQLVAMKQEVSPERRLSVPSKVADLDRVLRPLQRALYDAAETLGLEPSRRDGRRALLAMLHILWANLTDMSPEKPAKALGCEGYSLPAPLEDRWLAVDLNLDQVFASICEGREQRLAGPSFTYCH
jgi:hypothetical protein